MIWLSILLLTNLTLMCFVLMRLTNRTLNTDGHSILEHLGVLELACAAFLFLFAVFITFNKMEATRGEVLLSIVADKEVLMYLLTTFGFGIAHCSIAAVIISRLVRRPKG